MPIFCLYLIYRGIMEREDTIEMTISHEQVCVCHLVWKQIIAQMKW